MTIAMLETKILCGLLVLVVSLQVVLAGPTIYPKSKPKVEILILEFRNQDVNRYFGLTTKFELDIEYCYVIIQMVIPDLYCLSQKSEWHGIIMLDTRMDKSSNNWDVCYWLGKNSNQKDREHAAAYAIVADSKFHSTIQIRREIHLDESSDFQKLFQNPDSSSKDSSSTENRIDPRENRLISIRGTTRILIEELIPQLRYVLENTDHCLVGIFTNLYVYCEKSATEKQRIGAKELLKIMDRRGIRWRAKSIIIDLKHPLINMSDKEQLHFQELIGELGNITNPLKMIGDQSLRISRQNIGFYRFENEFTPREVRRIFVETEITDDGKEIFDTKLHRIQDGEMYENYYYGHSVLLETLDINSCYIIDTQSHLGIIVFIGKEAELGTLEKSASHAEKYLTEKEYDRWTPIHFVSQPNLPPHITTIDELIESMSH